MNTKSEKNRATPTPSAPSTQVAPSTRVTPATPPIPSPLSALSDTDKKMLELLLKGASGRTIAQRLGYKEGTTRVYLHSLYKRIGVNNKTSAVTWYLDTIAANEQNIEQVNQGQPMHRFNSFGDMAVRRGLLNGLGFLGVFVGPYGRMWEVASKLKDARSLRPTVADLQLRSLARSLWEALVAGDFAEGKRQFDSGTLPKVFVASPSDAVVLTMLLILGGYTSSAKKAIASLPPRKSGSLGVTADELRGLLATSDAVERGSDSAVAALHELIGAANARPVYRHVMLTALFHLYRMRGDMPRTMAVADAIWAEAESAQKHLAASGDKTLPPEATLPAPPPVTASKLTSYLEKLGA
ncbi:MAG: helix-turn-helix transcriptional regulator [Betaproteobacteria bacterium]